MVANNPYYISKLPETATVSYFDEAEWNKDLTPKEIEQQEALEASYIAEWEEWGKVAGYGPGFGSWIAKVAITTTAGIVLGPAAIPIGAAVWGGSKLAEECCDSEEDKKVFKFISDCGRDALIGGAIGGAVEVAGGAIGAASMSGVSATAMKNTDKIVGKVAGQWAAKEIAKGGSKAAYSAFAREATRVAAQSSGKFFTDAGRTLGSVGANLIYEAVSTGLISANEARIHLEHLDRGISYQSGCKVCEA